MIITCLSVYFRTTDCETGKDVQQQDLHSTNQIHSSSYSIRQVEQYTHSTSKFRSKISADHEVSTS